MNFADWHTDTVDVWREVDVMDGNLTRKERQQIYTGIPCRIYQNDASSIRMEQTSARIEQGSKLACDNAADIRAGDELFIHRGAKIGYERETIRAFAGDPNYYYEPFGAVKLGLSHQEIKLLQEERVK